MIFASGKRGLLLTLLLLEVDELEKFRSAEVLRRLKGSTDSLVTRSGRRHARAT
jgi:hypothetical protein